MSGSEITALVVAVVGAVVLTVLVFVVARLLQTVRDLQHTVEALREESVALVAELHEANRTANLERTRIDNVLRTAESVSGTVDSATRLAYLTMGSPVVKGLAAATGANQAYRRFRSGRRS